MFVSFFWKLNTKGKTDTNLSHHIENINIFWTVATDICSWSFCVYACVRVSVYTPYMRVNEEDGGHKNCAAISKIYMAAAKHMQVQPNVYSYGQKYVDMDKGM